MKVIVYISMFLIGFLTFGQSWEDTLSLGKELYTNKAYGKAYDKFISAQQYAPEDLELNNEIACSAYRKGDFETAEKVFQNEYSRTEKSTTKAALAQNLGNAQFKQEKYKEAIESYKQALRIDAKNEAARYNLAEAKRRLSKQLEKQKEQKENQNRQEKQDNQENNNQGDKNNPSKENNQDQNNSKDNTPNKSQNNEGEEKQSTDKLSSKKTERMLDELMKKEMKTKQKIQGSLSGGKNDKVKSGKKW